MDWVYLGARRHRGWPWPEIAPRDPMFGEDGWCRKCGVPKHDQTGSLYLQRKSLTVAGCWQPNWIFDTYCAESEFADRELSAFRVDLREVLWPATSPRDAVQLVVPTVGPEWFDPEELGRAASARHGLPGRECPVCGVWRWMPLTEEFVPAVQVPEGAEKFDAIASPEWFGDGMLAFRQVLLRRELAETMRAESPRDFALTEPILPS